MEAFIEFVREHKNLYRIVMEAQFVAPEAYRAYYDVFAEDYRRNLAAASQAGQIRPGHDEERAWALIDGVVTREALEQHFWLQRGAPEARILRTFDDGHKRIFAVAERKLLANPGGRIVVTANDFGPRR